MIGHSISALCIHHTVNASGGQPVVNNQNQNVAIVFRPESYIARS